MEPLFFCEEKANLHTLGQCQTWNSLTLTLCTDRRNSAVGGFARAAGIILEALTWEFLFSGHPGSVSHPRIIGFPDFPHQTRHQLTSQSLFPHLAIGHILLKIYINPKEEISQNPQPCQTFLTRPWTSTGQASSALSTSAFVRLQKGLRMPHASSRPRHRLRQRESLPIAKFMRRPMSWLTICMMLASQMAMWS